MFIKESHRHEVEPTQEVTEATSKGVGIHRTAGAQVMPSRAQMSDIVLQGFMFSLLGFCLALVRSLLEIPSCLPFRMEGFYGDFMGTLS